MEHDRARHLRRYRFVAVVVAVATSLRFGFIGNFYRHYDGAAQITWYSR